jgi:hypothetical protein
MEVDLSRAKPHPAQRAVEPDDPYNLHAVEVPGDPERMLALLVEEYARMGWDLESLMRVFREPFYRAAHGLWLLYGEDELRRRVASVLARSGVVRTRTVQSQPKAAGLVQIDIPQGKKEQV